MSNVCVPNGTDFIQADRNDSPDKNTDIGHWTRDIGLARGNLFQASSVTISSS